MFLGFFLFLSQSLFANYELTREQINSSTLDEECVRVQGDSFLLERVINVPGRPLPYYLLYSCKSGKCLFRMGKTREQIEKISAWIKQDEDGKKLIWDSIKFMPLMVVPGASTAASVIEKAVEIAEISSHTQKCIDLYKAGQKKQASRECIDLMNNYYFNSETNLTHVFLSSSHCGQRFFWQNLSPLSDPTTMVYNKIKKELNRDAVSLLADSCQLAEPDFAIFKNQKTPRKLKYAKNGDLDRFAETLQGAIIEHHRSRYPKEVRFACVKQMQDKRFPVPDDLDKSKIRMVDCKEVRAHEEEVAFQETKLGFSYDDSSKTRWAKIPVGKTPAISTTCLNLASQNLTSP